MSEEVPEEEKAGTPEEYIEPIETEEGKEEKAAEEYLPEEEVEEKLPPGALNIDQLEEMIKVSNLLEAAVSSDNPQPIIEQLTKIRRTPYYTIRRVKSKKQRRKKR
ncbi:MAG: hypothetical protein DRZ76_03600 [Candidatus Nealsonbacteria bacterium]|nr:MAG: hypothetical protein DRZ76_03600 [Candidatus Nealsonbacteria bacterium]